ncbi:hypothetical protein ElyMa_005154700 [Elysia marginata]|uniref:G-protein coupled receptors family 1 profile domain-containing protein n=1 Tax=Elysia marginata TaxID=1093978 RepID=A0AAV4JRJ0_9GAST|nr:hypothetical protein ElyMa_005154700 [Elysia marginata]
MGNAEMESDGNGANILLIVIISIVCINLLMIYKLIAEARKNVCSTNRGKHLILLFQAIGDIFIGLFPLNIRLQGLLHGSSMENVACWQRILAHTFLFHLMPFIHATGIILLTAESFLFWRQLGLHPARQPGRSWFSSRYLLASCLPWALGISVVAPLILIGFDFETCSVQSYSLQRIESIYWVSIILPGLFAIVAVCVYKLSSMPISSQISQASSTSLSKSISGDASFLFESSSKNGTDSAIARSQNMYYDYSKGCSECGTPYADYYTLQKEDDEPLIDHSENEIIFSFIHDEDLSSTIAWEKWNRIAAAVLFCICSMPSAILDLTFLGGSPGSSWPESVRVSTGIEALYRLHVLRSLISPLVWINEYS